MKTAQKNGKSGEFHISYAELTLAFDRLLVGKTHNNGCNGTFESMRRL